MTNKIIDLTNDQLTEFDPIECDFETLEEAETALCEVEAVIHDLRKMQEAITTADTLTSELFKKSFNRPVVANTSGPRFTTHDVLVEESDLLDTSAYLLDTINIQVARYLKFAQDIELEVLEMQGKTAEANRYGSYEDQVRDDYSGSR